MDITKTGLWQDYVTYGEDRPLPQTLAENERVRVIVAGLKEGQRIPRHPEAAAVYTVLDGEGAMFVNDDEIPVQQGSVILTREGDLRGFETRQGLVFMAVRLA